jgi:hypothetical protein
MAYFRIHRLSNELRNLDAQHLQLTHEAVAKSRELLKNMPLPDTFAGRKTQEPFPGEDDDILG